MKDHRQLVEMDLNYKRSSLGDFTLDSTGSRFGRESRRNIQRALGCHVLQRRVYSLRDFRYLESRGDVVF